MIQHRSALIHERKGTCPFLTEGRLTNHKLQAPPDDTYKAAFQRSGLPRFFLELRGSESAAEAAWLTQGHPFRSIGAAAMDQQFRPQELPALFDGVVFVEETTAAIPLE